MLAHLTGLLTRPAVADCLAPLLETIDSDTMSHLLTNLLSNPHVPRPMIGSLLGQVYNRTENADKPLIVSGMMKHLDGASVESMVALLGGESKPPPLSQSRSQSRRGSAQLSSTPLMTPAASRQSSMQREGSGGKLSHARKQSVRGGIVLSAGDATRVGVSGAPATDLSVDELEMELEARKEHERQMISTLEDAHTRQGELEDELARERTARLEMANFREMLASGQRAEVAKVRAELAEKVKAAAASAAEHEAKYAARCEALDGEIRAARALAASALDDKAHQTAQLRRANAAVEAERKARAAESNAAVSVRERLQTQLTHAQAVGGLAASEKEATEQRLSAALADEHARHVAALQLLDKERRRLAEVMRDLAEVFRTPPIDGMEGETAERLGKLEAAIKRQDEVIGYAEQAVEVAQSAKDRAIKQAGDVASEIVTKHEKAIGLLRDEKAAAEVEASEVKQQARADVAAAAAAAEAAMESERHQMLTEMAAERNRLAEEQRQMDDLIALRVKEAVEDERRRCEAEHAAALDALGARDEQTTAEAVAGVEKSKADAIAAAVAETKRVADARLADATMLVEKQAATELLKLQSEITLAHASGESVGIDIFMGGSHGASRRGSVLRSPRGDSNQSSFSRRQSSLGAVTSPRRASSQVRRISVRLPDERASSPVSGSPKPSDGEEGWSASLEEDVEMVDVGVQAGKAMMAPALDPTMAAGDQGSFAMVKRKSFAIAGEREELPPTCTTNLGLVVFANHNVRPMTVLRCRRLATTLLQCRYIFLRDDEKAGVSAHQDFKDWVVDQILLLYGTYPLASKNLAEFATGMRKMARWRRTASGSGREPDPIMHFFWRASQLGVPPDQAVGSQDLDFFCELLGHVADKVGSDVSLNMKGSGAFWAAAGMAVELVIPMWVLLAALRKGFARTQPELHRRMAEQVQMAARRYQKALRAGDVPDVTGYRRKFIGDARQDNHELLPLEAFVKHCMDVHVKVRQAEGERMQQVYASWDVQSDSSYDAFHGMVRHASTQIEERKILELYEQSLEPLTHTVSMLRINGLVRRAKLELRPKDANGAADGAGAAATEGASPALGTPAKATPTSKLQSLFQKGLTTVHRHNLVRSLFHNQLIDARAIMVADGEVDETADDDEEEVGVPEDAEDDAELLVSDDGDENDEESDDVGGALAIDSPHRKRSVLASAVADRRISFAPDALSRRVSSLTMARPDDHLLHAEGLGGLSEPTPSALFTQRPSWEPTESPPRAVSPQPSGGAQGQALSTSNTPRKRSIVYLPSA